MLPLPLDLDRDGARLHAGVAPGALLRSFEAALGNVLPEGAGRRLHGVEALRPLLADGSLLLGLAEAALGRGTRPVRAILFDKTAQTNWKLGWHQDRTIVVKRRIDVDGFGPWSTKAGLQHVAPPIDLLASMVTLRLHLDRVDEDNAPLLIAPGSHRLGRVPEREVQAAVERCGTFACLANAGDVWLYATPILHASEAASAPRRRRVLQVDYCARQLPGGLEWLSPCDLA